MTAAHPDRPETSETPALPALPYGSWPSPLTAEWASAASPRLEGAAFVGDEIWWGQSVPAEGGRTAVFRRALTATATAIETVLPTPWSARSAVHDYGGGAWAATDDGRLFFVEKSDQQVWRLLPGGTPQPLTADPAHRYGGLRWGADTLLAVRERATGADAAGDDTAAGTDAAMRAIVAIDVATGDVRTLARGTDFVAQPTLSPDGALLAWIGWDDPDMPWDHTRLRIARIDGDTPAAPVDVAGGSGARDAAAHDDEVDALAAQAIEDLATRDLGGRQGSGGRHARTLASDDAPRQACGRLSVAGRAATRSRARPARAR